MKNTGHSKADRIAVARADLAALHSRTPGGISGYHLRQARLTLAARRARKAASAQRWIILQCAGPSTVRLARALNDAGFVAWTPLGAIEKKRSYNRGKIEAVVPITSGIIFANEDDLNDLAMIRRLPVSPFPPFTFFSTSRGVPVIANDDRGLASLRAEQTRQQDASDHRVKLALEAAERARRAKEKTAAQIRTDEERRERRGVRKHFERGQRVTVDHPSCIGKIGIVESSDGKEARISFGGAFPMKAQAWQVHPE